MLYLYVMLTLAVVAHWLQDILIIKKLHSQKEYLVMLVFLLYGLSIYQFILYTTNLIDSQRIFNFFVFVAYLIFVHAICGFVFSRYAKKLSQSS